MGADNNTEQGTNLPDFRAAQLEFSAHIRNPDLYPRPADIEARRMQIYIDLFYNNIKSFLDGAFPVSRKVVGETRWRKLAREFVHLHPSESPYFLQISEEFMTFLDQRGLHELPPFLLELCHYEWVELALDVAVETKQEAVDPSADLSGDIVIADAVRALVYTYPVHTIGPGHQPVEPPAQSTYLLVYRNRELQVRFMASNPVTHRLLELLKLYNAQAAFAQIAEELNSGGHAVDLQTLYQQGQATLTRLFEAGIILGARPPEAKAG
jgi:uncharacterized protein